MEETEVQSGGCRCRAIRYEVHGPTIWSAGCCCRDCAAAAGTPYIVWVGFSPERVEFQARRPERYLSSPGVWRGYCGRCGTSLTYGRDAEYEAVEPTLYVAAATLDNPEAFAPTEVVWYAQRPAWFELGEGIPLHDTVSPNNAARSYTVASKMT